jgi:hypothetical protein
MMMLSDTQVNCRNLGASAATLSDLQQYIYTWA